MPDIYLEPEDLLSDESFLSWRLNNGDGLGKDWESWMKERPEHEVLVKKAIILLETTRLPEKQVPEQQLKAAEAALWEKLDSSPDRSTSGFRLSRYRWMAAASIILLLTAGIFLTVHMLHIHPEIDTAYGQISSNQLPDGTAVTLNANSRLKYYPGWKDGKDREVWVDGEAFFHVRKTPLKSRFIVHTTHFDIVVTGTEFNVVNRPGKTTVMLQEGSITLYGYNGKIVKMAPGDFIQCKASDMAVLERKTVKHDSVLAWKEQKLFLDSTSIRQLSSIIYDHYGIAVKLTADSLGDKKISGILPNNNLDILLRALEATGEFGITRDPDNSIVIGPHGK